MRARGYWCTKRNCMIWYTHDELKDLAIQRARNPIAPYVIQDSMDALKHPGDGRLYDSKSSFDQASKAMGLTAWEPPKNWDSNGTYQEPDEKLIEQDMNQAVERAYNDLKWGDTKLDDNQQQAAKEINEKYKAVTGKEPTLK